MPVLSRLLAVLGWFFVVGLGASPGLAAGITSAYTKLDFDACTQLFENEIAILLDCPGYKGYRVVVADVDLRQMVSYGPDAENEMAMGERFAPFNHVNTTLEWRLSDESGEMKPFATILRWFLDMDEEGAAYPMLVVTKLAPGNTCQIARIDVKLVPKANELARKIADTKAKDFDCANDEIMEIPD